MPDKPAPKFNIGDRVIPLKACLLIAGKITQINPPEEARFARDDTNRYVVELDIPHSFSRSKEHCLTKVSRNEEELEYCSIPIEETPYWPLIDPNRTYNENQTRGTSRQLH